ncbi:MAG: hypothetical protein IMW92_00415 [Bacillales bacterium]|nr:hypothetical protein [Bacillales bacterium]
MRDYVKRLIIVMAMGACIGILIIGGRLAYAKTINSTGEKHVLGFDDYKLWLEEGKRTP